MGLRDSTPRRRAVALAAAAALVSTGLVTVPAGPAHAATACGVEYRKTWDNGAAFGAAITIRNLGDRLSGWSLTYTWAGGQRVTNGWSATWTQSGAEVTARNASWNGDLADGGSVSIGFNGSYAAANPDPADFSINGTACTGQPATPQLAVDPPAVRVPEGGTATYGVRLTARPAGPVTVTSTAVGGDADITVTAGASLTFTPDDWNAAQRVTLSAAEDADVTAGTRLFTLGASGFGGTSIVATEVDNDVPVSKVDNPFAGAAGYRDPDWQGRVTAEAANHPPALAAAMRAAGQQSTAVWLDRIAAITAGRGLAGHLEAALAQDAANGAEPVVLTLVLYNLPNRSCAAPANGELAVTSGGLLRYRAEYIDAIRAVLAQPRYAGLRVAVVVEPDSLVNMVTHHQARPITTQRCVEAQASAVYREGIRYAVGQLTTLPNTYLYVDISTSAWLGWPENFAMAVNVYDNALAAAQGGPGYDKIHGFAVNTAAYTPIEEVFLPDPTLAVGGTPVFTARFYDFNPRFDDRDLATDLAAAFAGRGCAGCGMLIDTSRNGWGGPARPVTPSVARDVETYVNENRLDRRPSRLGGCNQVGTGIGARPTASTGIAGVDAFAWIKPPGESDGVSQPGIIDEDNPFLSFDPMCEPGRPNRYDARVPTNAMPGAPHRGRWFPQHFVSLVQNAHPAL